MRNQIRPGPAGHVLGAQPAPPQRRRAGALDDDVGGGEQPAQRVALRVEIDCVGELSGVHPIEERRLAAPGAVRSARAFHLDDDGAGAGEQLPAQRAGPQRRQVGHQQPVDPPRPGGWHRTVAPSVAPR